MKLQLKELEHGSAAVFCAETHALKGCIYYRGYPGIDCWGLRVFEDDCSSRVHVYLDRESAMLALKFKFNLGIVY